MNPPRTPTYTCIINEAQRKALAYALRQLPQVDLERFAAEAPMDDDVLLLAACLETLPEDEAEHPGITHGLCL